MPGQAGSEPVPFRYRAKFFDHKVDECPYLCPQDLHSDINTLNKQLYDHLNNGVYKSGFASTQTTYNEAVTVFSNVILNAYQIIPAGPDLVLAA